VWVPIEMIDPQRGAGDCQSCLRRRGSKEPSEAGYLSRSVQTAISLAHRPLQVAQVAFASDSVCGAAGLLLQQELASNQIIRGSESQSVRGMEHRKVLKVRVCIAGEKTGENTTIESPRINLRESGRLADERAHVFLGGVILVFTGAPTEQLIEFLKMYLGGADGSPVESRHHQYTPGSRTPCSHRRFDRRTTAPV
jgi:hypothetical protein